MPQRYAFIMYEYEISIEHVEVRLSYYVFSIIFQIHNMFRMLWIVYISDWLKVFQIVLHIRKLCSGYHGYRMCVVFQTWIWMVTGPIPDMYCVPYCVPDYVLHHSENMSNLTAIKFDKSSHC